MPSREFQHPSQRAGGRGRVVADLQPGMIRSVQDRAWRNKLAKGFSTADVPLEFCLLSAELAEAFEAWRRQDAPALGAELADVLIFLAGLAEMTGTDLQAEVLAKLDINEGRTYQRLPNGCSVKTSSKENDHG